MNESPNMTTGRKRTRMVRSYPTHTLKDALEIAATIHEANAGLPFDRKLLARALGTTPASSGYTMRLNSAAKYGLTQGAYNDAEISLTQHGEATVAPKNEAEKQKALVEAAMEPEIFGRFYRMLDGKRLPEDTYAQNMLQREFGIHPELTAECLGIIKANGLFVGVIVSEGGALYVRLSDGEGVTPEGSTLVAEQSAYHSGEQSPDVSPDYDVPRQKARGRIFVGHGGSSPSDEGSEFVKAMLAEFGIDYGIVNASNASGKPVSAAVSDEMRRCASAILVFDSDADASRMNYQVGAASVLYGDRVVIFRQSDVTISGELSGIANVEYAQGDVERSGLELLKALSAAGVVRIEA